MHACHIIVPLTARSLTDMNRQAIAAEAGGATAIELRLDQVLADGLDAAEALEATKEWNLPTIVTVRDPAEGGAWQANWQARLGWLEKADAAHVAYVDCELANLTSTEWRPQHAKLIASTHDFEAPIADAAQRIRQAFTLGAAIAKVAMMPHDAKDLQLIAELSEEFGHQPDRPVIALAMGDIGLPSRLLAGAWGFWGTFARLVEEDTGTAPGQPTVAELLYTYRLQQQNEDTCIFGVIGNPIGHSLSPTIHNAAFQHEDINAVYVPFRVLDANAFWKSCGAWLDGLSVTIPHKEPMLDEVEDLDQSTQDIGAMNTVMRCFDSGNVCGRNTDAPAIIRCLHELQPDLTGRTLLVIGAGGVARALVAATVAAGAEVSILNRTESRARALAGDLGATAITQTEAEAYIATNPEHWDIICNGTSVGMNDIHSSPCPMAWFHENCIAFDTVYTPLETRFLQDAACRGAAVVCGLSMFIHQAAEQFTMWTGIEAPTPVMSRAALQKLGGEISGCMERSATWSGSFHLEETNK
jgi:3-dehydroquinate dehydratase/shikimate dehydrogenase